MEVEDQALNDVTSGYDSTDGNYKTTTPPPFSPTNRSTSEAFMKAVTGFVLTGVLLWFSQKNYLLFHSLAEMFSIAVAIAVFMVVWNSKKIITNNSMLILGIAYLFIGLIDLIHTLAYKGMGVFPLHAEPEYATQLWIAARFMECLSLLLFASWNPHRHLRPWSIIGVYAALTAIIFASIFAWGIFPSCYVTGTGLTLFKKYSEYIISGVLAAAIIVLWKKKSHYDIVVFRLMIAALTFTIAGELAFTFYVSVYGFSNLVGHFFKIFSFFMVYLALVRSGLSRPGDVIFRELKLSREQFAAAYNCTPLLMGISSIEEGIYLDVNDTFEKITGYTRKEAIGVRSVDLGLISKEDRERLKKNILRDGRVEAMDFILKTKQGKERRCRIWGEIILTGNQKQLLSMVSDITEQKEAEDEREMTIALLKTINEQSDIPGLIRDITKLMLEWSDCSAVGVRLRQGEDFPYFETRGFPEAFVKMENSLCGRDSSGEIVRDQNGNPVLECMCGNILCGRFDPSLPFFTENGSFWTNSTSQLLASTSESDRQARTRNRCNGEGYESVALIPIRYGETTFGLLQVNDFRKGMFSEAIISLYERLAGYLAVALKERRDVESLEEERSLMHAVLASTPDLIVLKDLSGIYRIANPAFCRFLGKTVSEVVGKTDFDLFPAEDAELYIAGDTEVVQTGNPESGDWDVVGKDGKRWLQVIKTAVKNSRNQISGVLCSVRDITKRKQTESLLKARLRLSAFAGPHTFEELLMKTLDEAESLTGSQISFFHFMAPDQETIQLQQWSASTLEFHCSVEPTNRHYPLSKAGIWADCVRKKQPVIHNDYESHAGKKGMPPGHTRVIRQLVVPVLDGETVTAMLGVGNKPMDYTQDDAALISELATMAWEIATRKKAELNFHESSRRLQTLMDNLPGMVYRCTNDRFWTMAYVSDGCRQLTGYNPDALINNRDLAFSDIIHPDHQERVHREVQMALTENRSFELEYLIRNRDGRERWVWERGRLVPGSSNEPQVLEGFISDITDRKEAESHRALQAMVLDQIQDRVVITDMNGIITYLNKAATLVLGGDREAIIGKTTDVFGDDPDRGSTQQEILSRTLSDGTWRGEVVNITGDGCRVVVDCRTTVIKDEEDNAVALCGVATDITEKIQHESELRQLALAIGQAAEAIMITGTDGTIQYVNPAFETVSGYTREEVEGKNPRLLKSGMHDPEFYRDLWQTITGNKTWQGRIINRKKDNSLFTQEGTVSPVMDDGGRVINFVSVMRDITEDLKLEDRLSKAQRLEAIGTLAGGIAHDFNNILFPMVGLSEILQQDLPEESPMQEIVEEILKAGLRARDLVKQILAFSRENKAEKSVIRVQNIAKEVLKLVKASLPSTIRVKQWIKSDCPVIMADPTQIHQILMNLITNAFHAMEPEGGTLGISLKEAHMDTMTAKKIGVEPGEHVCLEISDTGCGIEEDVMERIFDPYFTTKPEGKGTGLGLSVIHGIVKSCNGGIRVDSKPGIGTTFQVYLPCFKGKSGQEKSDKKQAPAGGDERILIVDDETAIISMLEQILVRLGYQVTAYTSSIEALGAFRKDTDRFDLVITDLTMPDMTGDRLSREMKQLRPGIPIILCTGFSDQIDDEKASSTNVDAYILKPLIRKEIDDAIRKALKK